MTNTAYKNGNNSDSGVTLEGINLSFGKTHVLKGIDLKIESGEFFAFLGHFFSGYIYFPSDENIFEHVRYLHVQRLRLLKFQ